MIASCSHHSSKYFLHQLFSLQFQNFPKIVDMSVENEIKKVAKYFQLPIGKFSYTDDHTIQMKTSGEQLIGFSTILNHLHNVLAKEKKSAESFFLTKQFFEYANLFIRSNSRRDKSKFSLYFKEHSINNYSNSLAVSVCSELNTYLESRSYLVGQSISIADLVVFHAVAETMKQLSLLDKDQFVNLSRWFDHLQQKEAIRQGTSLVNFSSIHLPRV